MTLFSDDEYLDLGPLPISSEESARQRESFAALERVLPSDRLVFRRECKDDLGSDGTIELQYQGRGTNFRSCAQVKARSGIKENVDGSISVPVEVSNLNYLANSSCPLYIIYRPETDELRYAWARDEFMDFINREEKWKYQQTVTIRFIKILNREACDEIADRILRDGRLTRSVNDKLQLLALVSTPLLRIDRDALDVETSEEAFDSILEQGLYLIASGHANSVLELSRLLTLDQLRVASLQLILGYAEYSRGRFLRALDHFADIQREATALTEQQHSLRVFLTAACELEIGQLKEDEFFKRLESWRSEAPSDLAIQYDLMQLWSDVKEVSNRTERRERQRKLHNYAAEIIELTEVLPVLKFQAERYILAIRAEWISAQAIGVITFSNQSEPIILRQVFGEKTPQEHLQSVMSEWEAWEKRVQNLRERVLSFGHEPMACSIDYLLESGRLALVAGRIHGAAHLGKDLPSPNSEMRDRLIELIEKADLLGQVEIRTRVRLLLAEFLDILEFKEEAIELAKDVMAEARLLQFNDLMARAEDLASGKSNFWKTLERIRKVEQSDPFDLIASMSDSEIEEYTQLFCERLNLPAEREDVVRNEMIGLRLLANEKRIWCRHLEFLEDLSHTELEDTFYSHIPNKVCHCGLHEHRSLIPQTDLRNLIQSFKSTRREGCCDRQAQDRITKED
jgi:hypothetical protein